MNPAPRSLEAARARLADLGHPPDSAERTGMLLRTLAAARPGGVFLYASRARLADSLWLAEGMDITSRLVVNVAPGTDTVALQPVLAEDLRITIHAQRTEAFLDDVRRHAFDLVVLDAEAWNPKLADRAIAQLDVGGFLVLVGTPSSVRVPDACWHAVLDGCVLATRASETSRPRRRGGRAVRRTEGGGR